MIYRREEYIEEGDQDSKFPVKRIDAMIPTGDGGTPRYIGSVTLGLQTPMGVQQLPISFEIEAANIEEAFTQYEAAAEPRIEEAQQSLQQEMQRARQEAQNRIVTPGEMGIDSSRLGQGGQGGGGNVIDFKNLK